MTLIADATTGRPVDFRYGSNGHAGVCAPLAAHVDSAVRRVVMNGHDGLPIASSPGVLCSTFDSVANLILPASKSYWHTAEELINSVPTSIRLRDGMKSSVVAILDGFDFVGQLVE